MCRDYILILNDKMSRIYICIYINIMSVIFVKQRLGIYCFRGEDNIYLYKAEYFYVLICNHIYILYTYIYAYNVSYLSQTKVRNILF